MDLLSAWGMRPMLTCHVFIATSLDGFIARPDGSLDWLAPFDGDGDNGYGAFVSGMDGIIMGRGTYEAVLGFGKWPYDRPVVVMSRSLSEQNIPPELLGRVSVSSRAPRDLVNDLSANGWRRACVDGGAIIQSFLSESLIADMAIFRMPVLIGNGRPLFGSIGHDIRLELTGVDALCPLALFGRITV